jgi:hypothetical protein
MRLIGLAVAVAVSLALAPLAAYRQAPLPGGRAARKAALR